MRTSRLSNRINHCALVRLVVTGILCGWTPGTFAQGDVSLVSHPYRAGGLFPDAVLPTEGQDGEITVRAQCREVSAGSITARLTIRGPHGGEAARQDLVLHREQDTAEATWPWVPPTNGMYRITAELDPVQRRRIDDGEHRVDGQRVCIDELVDDVTAPHHDVEVPLLAQHGVKGGDGVVLSR